MNGKKLIRLSDYVMKFIAQQGVKHIFMVSGGGGMYLFDSLGRSKDIKYICNHHEQACAISAEGYQRTTNNLGVAMVTTGPGGTNTITGVMCSWDDSIPVIFISGQANSKLLIGNTGRRQRGVQEVDITKLVESITKYAVTITDETTIRYHLEKSVFLAKTGRPGPVWIAIPLDIQAKMIDERMLPRYFPQKEIVGIKAGHKNETKKIKILVKLLKKSDRPIIIAGNGIRLSHSEDKFLKFIEKYQIPVVTTKNGFDLIYYKHPLRVGSIGINGQRAANFAVQNADLVLSLGSSLPLTVVGYETKLFAREAKKIVVDIDEAQLKHPLINTDVVIHADLKDFFQRLGRELGRQRLQTNVWVDRCKTWRDRFPLVEMKEDKSKRYVNSYYFFDILSDYLSPNDTVITDQGATFYSSSQALKLKRGQRYFTNGGCAPMGYGLPAAIGSCFADLNKQVICVHGDGGLEMNLQELQTMVFHNLPIKLFVFNNQGYLSIKHTQSAYFEGFLVGSDPKSGVSCPDFIKIAKAYGIATDRIQTHNELKKKIFTILSRKGPMLIEVILDPHQPFLPKVSSMRDSNGKIISKPLEDMYPFLPRDEFHENMIIEPLKEG
ncbi:MAG: thiamine pyrophosphate-binding protein [Microgenomates group bacterium]